MRITIPFVLSVASMLGCGRQLDENASLSDITNADAMGVEAATIVVPNNLDIPLDIEPSENEPLAIGARFDRDKVKAGETIKLVVRCKIAKSWHIYSVDGPTGISRPTKLSILPPEPLTTASPWALPTSKMTSSVGGPTAIYEGDVQFSIQLAIAQSADSGEITVPCEFHYQACTDVRCLPPTTKTLEIPLTIVSMKEE